MTTPSHKNTAVAAFNPTGPPPICDECELPMEEVTHGYVYLWACVRDLCANRFRATFEELTDPEFLIIFGRPECYRCHQRRDMTQIGNVVRFECPNPGCDEVLRLISAKNKRARAAVAQAAAAAALVTLPPAGGRARRTNATPARRPPAR
ncbi:hypothetical protein [Cryobacterium sp. Y11]|uniref:hypothetical protein n=1 Tax=Cryobacterium sp. Y11 TaxID=2045016 RepID=UPI0011B0C6DC|nr:hypothetical protein [Cryobacterium sp. Y11]